MPHEALSHQKNSHQTISPEIGDIPLAYAVRDAIRNIADSKPPLGGFLFPFWLVEYYGLKI
jgi:hypothetical protein